ncbi:MAG: Gluconeogenesis factor [Chlamydiia bacterium]|nr:Gluconeogenesis factor [Chlamydiia bacterium]
MSEKRLKVCTIGGGTGNFVVLRGLKQFPIDISAIVSMADDGGSTGILRDELGVLPAGDVRQCMVALSDSSFLMRNLMNYRFENGGLSGHSFGNLFLSALEKVTGSFERAVEEVGRILNIQGKVIPVTTQQVRLRMVLKNRKLLEGEKQIYLSKEIDKGYQSIYLEPYPKANPHAISEIMEADAVVIGPGGLHTSLIANLLVDGVADALLETRAKKIFVVNLMNRKGQTTGYQVSDYVAEMSKYLGRDAFDHIIVNRQLPPKELIEVYREEGELVCNDMEDPRVELADLLGAPEVTCPSDLLRRNLIRHDSNALAEKLMEILEVKKGEKDSLCYASST